MKKADDLKKMVAEKYGDIAEKESSCCDSACACDDYSFIGDSYQSLEGYVPEADLGLGCGLPTEFAHIEPGEVVVDLGSGAGNDCFVARSLVGPLGKVIGVDFTPAMIEKARENARKLEFKNVHFVEGDIENLPLDPDTADVVVSNCVLNLVPDKRAAFRETYRILKPGGHFSISDVIINGDLPKDLKEAAELYAGCVSGAIPKEDYLRIISDAGFKNVQIQKEREITIPEETLSSLLSPGQLEEFKTSNLGIYSITVYGEKPQEPCCDDECC
ncbi:MAG: arsenite methyltransferase [Cyclobacteriaceae bacterium]|nr:arsenite methyltransferase [Cyclobacteriaceae bacterium]